jgi:thioesterase domain-containing protein
LATKCAVTAYCRLFSFSGLLAYEIARRLHAAGEQITGVALLEPVTPLAATPGRAYGAVAATDIFRSIAARDGNRSRLLLRLAARSVLGPRAANAERLPMAYGYLVEAAECLQTLPIPIDLVYSDGFPKPALARWRAVAGAHLRAHHVVATEHAALIRSECIQQWRHVVDRWGTQRAHGAER